MVDKDIYMHINFAGLPKSKSSWENSKVVVIPVPYDATTSYISGTRHGPTAIINASTHLELFDEEIKQETSETGIHTLPHLEIITSSPDKMVERVEKVVAGVIDEGKFPVLLGGEHSVTVGVVRAFGKRYPEMGVLQLDAHADLRDSYQQSAFSHACTGRRIHEHCHLIQAGIRSISREEFDFLADEEIKSYFFTTLEKNTAWIEELINALPQKIYITVDLDVLDPSIMPSVGTPEPGGFGWYEILNVLREISKKKNILGFDIMELCPQSMNHAPDFLAAKLCYKLIGYATVYNRKQKD